MVRRLRRGTRVAALPDRGRPARGVDLLRVDLRRPGARLPAPGGGLSRQRHHDAWYGRTAGPYQHLSHLVMRAIETRAGTARAANSGISATVDPVGHVHDASGREV